MSTTMAGGKPQSGQRERQIFFLFLADIILMVMVITGGGFKNDFAKFFQLTAICLHTPIGIWIGFLITKSDQNRWMIIAYWLSVAAPVLSIFPYVFFPLRIFFPFGLAPTGVFIQWAVIVGILSKRFTKGRWPLPAALLCTAAGVIFILINVTFETTEFGPLGMLFVNMFATPILVLAPALLRWPASSEITRYVRQFQYATYGCVVLFWIIFAGRTFK